MKCSLRKGGWYCPQMKEKCTAKDKGCSAQALRNHKKERRVRLSGDAILEGMAKRMGITL
jgi:hypothetical protein